MMSPLFKSALATLLLGTTISCGTPENDNRRASSGASRSAGDTDAQAKAPLPSEDQAAKRQPAENDAQVKEAEEDKAPASQAEPSAVAELPPVKKEGATNPELLSQVAQAVLGDSGPGCVTMPQGQIFKFTWGQTLGNRRALNLADAQGDNAIKKALASDKLCQGNYVVNLEFRTYLSGNCRNGKCNVSYALHDAKRAVIQRVDATSAGERGEEMHGIANIKWKPEAVSGLIVGFGLEEESNSVITTYDASGKATHTVNGSTINAANLTIYREP